jgi:threonine synthase
MTRFLCAACGNEYALDIPRWRCDCGSFLDIEFDYSLDVGAIAGRAPVLWRYREALPLFDDRHLVSLGEGFTPLLESDVFGEPVWLKHDHLFPTGSFKDRGAALLVSKAAELAVDGVVEDSSGNAGCAVAAYCARAGIACEILVPEDTSDEKLAQIAIHGATLTRIPGNREETARAALRRAADVYYASHCWNPFFLHGTKTVALEICEQLGWRPPDTLVVPVGNGSLLLGADIGFRELRERGLIDREPRLVGVQSANCAPLFRAFEENLAAPGQVRGDQTLAEGIAIAEPLRGSQILDAVRRSEGSLVAVDEIEIEEALLELAASGLFVEPTAAAGVAGWKRYRTGLESTETTVVVLTGHGLKAAAKTIRILDARRARRAR